MNIIKTLDSCLEACYEVVENDLEKHKIMYVLGRLAAVLEILKHEINNRYIKIDE